MPSHGDKNILIDCGDDFLSSSLLLSSSGALLPLGRPLVTCKGVHPGLEVALLEVRLDRRRERGNLLILRRCDEWRKVGLAVLFVCSGSRRDQRSCHPSTSSEYQSSRRSQVRDRPDSRAGSL